jgi:hypothetical protein
VSHIAFNETYGLGFEISGCERAHMVALHRDAVEPEKIPQVVTWLHEYCELAGWIANEDVHAFADAIRAACHTTLRTAQSFDGSTRREPALRVGMSVYRRRALNSPYDRSGCVQSWWSLVEWMTRGVHPGDLILSYSVCSPLQEMEGHEHLQEMGGHELEEWLRSDWAHMRWSPDWRPEVGHG